VQPTKEMKDAAWVAYSRARVTRSSEKESVLAALTAALEGVTATAPKPERNTPRRVHARVVAILDNEQEPAGVCVVRIALQLGTTPKLLQRQLRNNRTPWRSLQDAAFKRIACEQLELGKSIEWVSVYCGFSEISPFYRAFKRWTGMTPGMYQSKAASA